MVAPSGHGLSEVGDVEVVPRGEDKPRGETHCATVCAGQEVPFQLLVVGPYVEFSMCGEVVIAAMTWERPQGRVGIWAETGQLRSEMPGRPR